MFPITHGPTPDVGVLLQLVAILRMLKISSISCTRAPPPPGFTERYHPCFKVNKK
jgi:hypothetical protein